MHLCSSNESFSELIGLSVNCFEKVVMSACSTVPLLFTCVVEIVRTILMIESGLFNIVSVSSVTRQARYFFQLFSK